VRPIWFLFSFGGRINRESYWLFFGACFALSIVLQIVVGAPSDGEASIFWLILLWPALAIIVKRYHDCDRSAGWVLVHFVIPPLGIYQCGFLRGTPGTNRFGPAPPDSTAEEGAAVPRRRLLDLLGGIALLLVAFLLSSVILVNLLISGPLEFSEYFWGTVLTIALWWAAFFYLQRAKKRRLTPGRTDGPLAS